MPVPLLTLTIRGKKSERRAKGGRVMTGEQRVEEKDEWVAESQVQRHMFL